MSVNFDLVQKFRYTINIGDSLIMDADMICEGVEIAFSTELFNNNKILILFSRHKLLIMSVTELCSFNRILSIDPVFESGLRSYNNSAGIFSDSFHVQFSVTVILCYFELQNTTTWKVNMRNFGCRWST
ncbi:hypothetical protein CHUAL_009123 [Chamberlinius hualienensis]